MLRLLRTIKDIDAVRYSTVKKQLPYFTCATFVPPYLSLENFAYTEHFIVEVQNLGEKGIDMEELKSHLAQDERVAMMFASPGKDGLKVMFFLKERCYDNGVFNVFYNLFLKEFYEKHSLDIDIQTTGVGVTDACFISVDEHAYYNPNAVGIDIEQYVGEDNPAHLFESMRELRHIAKENKRDRLLQPKKPEEADPNQETLLHIKEVLLGAKSVERDKKPLADTAVMNDIVAGMKLFVEDHGVEVKSVRSILNARKIQFALGEKTAEINIFRGTKGFFAVQSPVGSNSKEFTKVVIEMVNAYLADKKVCQEKNM